MTKAKTDLRIFTVVDVWRGMVVGVRNFRDLKNAQHHMQRLVLHRNLEQDDVQLFETAVALSSQGTLLEQLAKPRN
jgi:imidazole glycerol phosphate synthase subunit HisF